MAQITFAAGTALSLGGGTHQVSATGSIIGDGDFSLSGSVFTLAGTYDVRGSNHSPPEQ